MPANTSKLYQTSAAVSGTVLSLWWSVQRVSGCVVAALAVWNVPVYVTVKAAALVAW